MPKRRKPKKPSQPSGRLLRTQSFVGAKYNYGNIDAINFIEDFTKGKSRQALAKKYFKTENTHPVNFYIRQLKKRFLRGKSTPMLSKTHENKRKKAQGK